ncbi:DNA binding protein [Sigmofec virus UA08Rod_5894]|uniref:DNA binding protein n=1 Tax=Sigmofec virus UA08Rod_5894 TaxID=2929443 RepID=A0A976N0W7_9VIRU|nr:DNA binding protein [Sigmofec virus UA08Rod_5894]
MARRKVMPRRTDKRYFRRTAAASKKINVDPVIYRGGIRL